MTAGEWAILAGGHAPAVIVAAPLLAALAALLATGPRVAFALALVSLVAAGAAAAILFVIVLNQGPFAYVLTDGLAWRIDAWSTAFAAMACALAGPALLIGGAGALKSAAPGPASFSIAAALVVVGGMAAAAFAAHLMLVVLCLQAAGLAYTVLVVAGADSARAPPLNAALRVLAGFGVAGALGWFGAALTLAGAGVADPAQAFARLGASPPAATGVLVTALAVGLVGLIAPMDHWGASVLSRGPSLAGLVALAVIAPLSFAVFARAVGMAADLGAGLAAGVLLIVLGTTGALVAAVQALAAQDLRRLAGYAFAAHIGCALIGLALATPEGAAAAALKALGAALAALLLAAAGSVETQMRRLDGLARRAPLAALCAALGCFLLMSAPFTVGYGGSWALVEAALARGWWAAAALTVAVSLAGVVFGGRLLERMYFRAPHADAPARPTPLQTAGLALLAVAAVAAGFAGGPIADWAEAAGEALWAWPTGAPLMGERP